MKDEEIKSAICFVWSLSIGGGMNNKMNYISFFQHGLFVVLIFCKFQQQWQCL
jgi:hypothetical protein